MDRNYFIDSNGGGCNNGFGWGGDGLLGGLVLGGLVGGWGNGGWGGRGGYGDAATVQAVDTASINDRIGEEAIEEKVCRVEMAIGDAKYASALGDKDLTMAIMQGNNATQQQIAECCCNTNVRLTEMGYQNQISNLQQTNLLEKEFCKVNRNIDDLRRDAEVSALRERVRVQDALLFQASQENQTARIIAALSAPATTA